MKAAVGTPTRAGDDVEHTGPHTGLREEVSTWIQLG
jgi:hypothetical protein